MNESESRKRALCWQFFRKEIDGNVSFTQCLLCEASDDAVSGKLKYNGSTSSMNTHLKAIHPEEYGNYLNKKHRVDDTGSESSQSTIASSSSTTASSQPKISSFLASLRPISNADVENINYHLAYMICSDLQPFSLVEDEGFVEFCRALNPKYKVPSRKTLQKQLSSLYRKVLSFMRSHIQQAQSVAVTTDIWKSKSNRSYLTTTAHYIVNNELFNCSLDTLPITKDETADTLARMIEEIFQSWSIREKLSLMVTDNAANVIATCRKLAVHRVPCMGHLLNLCVTDLVKNGTFKKTFKKCKKIVTEFRKSGPMKLELDRIQLELDNELAKPLNLIGYTKTRWNSRLAMIDRILKLRQSLELYWEIDKDSERLTETDFNILTDFSKVLSPLAEATNSLSGKKYITISSVIPIINCTIEAVKKVEPETSTGKVMMNSLSTALMNRFKSEYYSGGVSLDIEEDQFLRTATYIDPRFKAKFFDKRGNVENVRDYIHTKLATNTNSQSSSLEQVESKVDSIWTNNKYSSSSTIITDINSILTQYESSPLMSPSSDPLLVGSNFGSYSGELDKLKQRFLCGPATSVPSESFFSSAEYITGDRRNCISDENLNLVAFLHTNLPIYRDQLMKDGVKQFTLSFNEHY